MKEILDSILQQSDYLRLLTGLGFLIMAVMIRLVNVGKVVVLRVLGERTQQWNRLLLFCMLQGLYQWMNNVSLSLMIPNLWLIYFNYLVLFVSYYFLMSFCYVNVIKFKSKRLRNLVFLLQIVLVLSGILRGTDYFYTHLLYFLALPGLFLTGYYLFNFHLEGVPRNNFLKMNGIGFWVFGIFLFLNNAQVPFSQYLLPGEELVNEFLGFSTLIILAISSLFIGFSFWNFYNKVYGDYFKKKQTNYLYLIITILVLVLVGGWFVTNAQTQITFNELTDVFKNNNRVAAATLDPDKVKALYWDKRAIGTPAYEEIKYFLRKVKYSDPKVSFVCLVGYMNGKCYILADSEIPGTPNYSPPGQYYFEATHEYIRALQAYKPFLIGPLYDRWGIWMETGMPLVKASGQRYIYLTMDFDIKKSTQFLAFSRIYPLTITGLICVLILLFLLIQHRTRILNFSLLESQSMLEIRVAERTKQLEETQKFNTTLLESMPEMMLVHQNKAVVYVNKAMSQTTGYSSQELMGTNILNYLPEESRNKVIENLSKRMNREEIEEYEIEIICKSAVKVNVLVRADVIDYNGHPAVLSMLIDITERKKNERLLYETMLEAKKANSSKSKFLSITSHELKTPLNGIMGMIGLITDTELNAEQRNYLEVMNQCGESLQTLIQNILDYTIFESGQAEIENQVFKLSEIVKEIFQKYHLKLPGKDVEISYKLEDNLPEFVSGDALKIRQILDNLLNNAVKFTRKGIIRITVKNLSETEDVARIKFEIQDTGIGIDEKRLDSLFQPFTQLDSSYSRSYNGLGLGLAMAKQITEHLQGEIGVTSKLNEGSLFWFTINLFIVRA